MSEVLVQFDEPQLAANGCVFVTQIRCKKVKHGLWGAWIEFQPRDGGESVRTGIETEQLTRGDLRYWAAGLSRPYLDGALARALHPGAVAIPRSLVVPTVEENPTTEQTVLETNRVRNDEPLLNPDALYQQSGEHTLRQELRALNARQLRDIIAAYDIPETEVHDLARTFEDALAERIVAGVQHRVRPVAAEATERLARPRK